MHRRTFLQASLAALVAVRADGAFGAPAGSAPDEVFLNRLTFGATPSDRARLATLGRAAWLDEQLALPPLDDALRDRLGALRLRIAYEAGEEPEVGRWEAMDELRPLTSLDADPATLMPLLDWERAMEFQERERPAREVVAAALPRAVHAAAQLREVMTQFLHDHFNVALAKSEVVAVFLPAYDRMLRANAFGNFRSLLGEVATSPAMLAYLDQADSRASPANENFARELLELHTLGIDAYLNDRHPRWDTVPKDAVGVAVGYIDEDVYEVARALTGWSIGDGRWLDDALGKAEVTGRFAYVDAWHDPYQKRVLDVEFAPHGAPLADGERVLDLLAGHPATARHLCTKIARRFLADDPDPALVDRLVAVWTSAADAPDQIGQVVRALALDPAFDAPPTKLRRPFEVLAATYRASGADVDAPEAAFDWRLQAAGWKQHNWPSPDGHPDRLADWASGGLILRLVDLVLYAHEDWAGTSRQRLDALLPPEAHTPRTTLRHWAARVQGPDAERLDEVVPLLREQWGLGPDDPLPDDPALRHELSAVALAAAFLSPRALTR